MTIIQSLNLVYLIFSLLICSLLIKTAIQGNKIVLLEILIHAPGIFKPIVYEPAVEADPTSISVMVDSVFTLINLFYIFLIFHYQL